MPAHAGPINATMLAPWTYPKWPLKGSLSKAAYAWDADVCVGLRNHVVALLDVQVPVREQQSGQPYSRGQSLAVAAPLQMLFTLILSFPGICLADPVLSRLTWLACARQIPAAAPCPPYYPFPRGKSILGVIYGVLLWADMNAATPLRAWGRSVISLAVLLVCTVVLKPCQSALALLLEKQLEHIAPDLPFFCLF